MEFLIGILVGIFIGGLSCWLIVGRKESSGLFTIDLSDAMIDEAFGLTLYEGLNELSMKKRMIIDIKTIMDNSQK